MLRVNIIYLHKLKNHFPKYFCLKSGCILCASQNNTYTLKNILHQNQDYKYDHPLLIIVYRLLEKKSCPEQVSSDELAYRIYQCVTQT